MRFGERYSAPNPNPNFLQTSGHGWEAVGGQGLGGWVGGESN